MILCRSSDGPSGGRRLAGGTVAVLVLPHATHGRRLLSPVEVPVHPDPRCQRVLEQVREAEVVQAGDRVRPVFNQRDMTFLNSLALDAA